jgi:DNA-binding Lrp family transcriptional regulator
MDELDVRILRALIYESAVAPSAAQVNSSLRSIAARIGADDMTVNYRYRRLQQSGALSGWQLTVNPTFFGCGLADVTVDVEPESAKADVIRKLKLVQEVTGIIDFYGKAMTLIVMFNGEESRLRIIELISRITNSERVVQVRWTFPYCKIGRLTETDVAIIRALSNDARKSFVQVSKELGLSTRTVRTRILKLRRENVIFTVPRLNMSDIPGLIPVYLSYSYSKSSQKGTVDRAMLSHFEASYFTVGFSDPDNAFIVSGVPKMSEVRNQLEWAKSQPGIVNARTDLIVRNMMFPEKIVELLERREAKSAVQTKASSRRRLPLDHGPQIV